MSSEDSAALEREFDLLMAKAGVVVPADRKAGALACYLDHREMAVLLHQRRPAADEPSNVYSLQNILRSA